MTSLYHWNAAIVIDYRTNVETSLFVPFSERIKHAVKAQIFLNRPIVFFIVFFIQKINEMIYCYI